MLAVCASLLILLWREYMLAPWTRDGRVSAEIVQMAPEVSGTVVRVNVVDNQFVHKGDLLYQIDPVRFQDAVDEAEATASAKQHDMQMKQATADRCARLPGAVSADAIETANDTAAVATANYRSAMSTLDVAKLNLERSTICSPVTGYVTNLRLRPGDYATSGIVKVAVVDSESFWITGYFEETKLRRIRTGDKAEIRLMGFDQIVTGHVESFSRGIADENDSPDHLRLPSVNPVFTWVRLAQRIPVRIQIDDVPHGVQLAAGMTCSVAVGSEMTSHGSEARLVDLLRTMQ